MTTNSESLGGRYDTALMRTYGSPRAVLVRGHGAHVWDEHGREYVDLLGGIAVNALGHGHPKIVEAVTRQLSTLGHISNFFASPPQIALAERLLGLLGAPASGRVFFTNSGTEANEAAFKLTRLTGRTELIAADDGFHGRTMGALALTSKAAYREPFEPLPGGVRFVPYDDPTALREAVSSATAAVVLEPIQGEAGVVVPHQGYLAEAAASAHDVGALLWLDEIQTGIARTGRWFAHHPHSTHPGLSPRDPGLSPGDPGLSPRDPGLSPRDPGVSPRDPGVGTPALVHPDVVTLAKGLAGGFPIGACIGVGPAADLLQPGSHGTTFGGNPVACAAALAVLDTIESEGLLERATKLGETLRQGLDSERRVREVRGEGLLIGLDLTQPLSAEVAAAALEAGFIINNPTPQRIRLAPPLVLTDADVDRFLEAWPLILDQAYPGGE